MGFPISGRDTLEARIAAGQAVAPKDTPRLLVTGCRMVVPNRKVPFPIETSGAVIVGEESCVGTRNIRALKKRGCLGALRPNIPVCSSPLSH